MKKYPSCDWVFYNTKKDEKPLLDEVAFFMVQYFL